MGYGQSLFARIQKCIEHLPENPIKILSTQHRMHVEICKFPNEQFYGGKLITPSTLNRHNSPFQPYCIFSLCTRNYVNEDAYVNLPEADVALLITQILLERSAGMTIGIITPYSKQKIVLVAKLDIIMK